MSYTITVDGKMVIVTYRGSFTVDELQASRLEVAGFMVAQKCDRILIDFTGATPETSFLEIFGFAGTHKEDINPLIKTASIIPRKTFPDFYAYLEKVSNSFQNAIAYFETIHEGKEWLTR